VLKNGQVALDYPAVFVNPNDREGFAAWKATGSTDC
jgi:hypothetical protein